MSTRLVNKTETVPSGAAKRMARRRNEVRVRRCVGELKSPRDELMCMYPLRCHGTCVKQLEDGYACSH